MSSNLYHEYAACLFDLLEMTSNFLFFPFPQRMPAERFESSSSKKASKENEILEKRIQLRSESTASETEGLMRDSKRPKNLSRNNDGSQPNVTHQSKPMTSECNSDLQSRIDLDSCSNTSVCSFCQSSRTSEVIYMILA